jgi:hypothetical protein
MAFRVGALAIRSDEETRTLADVVVVLVVLIPLSVALAIGIAMDGRAASGH